MTVENGRGDGGGRRVKVQWNTVLWQFRWQGGGTVQTNSGKYAFAYNSTHATAFKNRLNLGVAKDFAPCEFEPKFQNGNCE
jgi:hypothetical protein